MPYLPESDTILSSCNVIMMWEWKMLIFSCAPLGCRPCILAGQAGNPFTWSTQDCYMTLNYEWGIGFFLQALPNLGKYKNISTSTIKPWQIQDPRDWMPPSWHSCLPVSETSEISWHKISFPSWSACSSLFQRTYLREGELQSRTTHSDN